MHTYKTDWSAVFAAAMTKLGVEEISLSHEEIQAHLDSGPFQQVLVVRREPGEYRFQLMPCIDAEALVALAETPTEGAA